VLQSVAVCCSMLKCVAVCCSVLQCVAECCSVLQCSNTHCMVSMQVSSQGNSERFALLSFYLVNVVVV